MSLTKRLEVLEAKVNALIIESVDIISVIIAPDRSIARAVRRGEEGEMVNVTPDELEEIRSGIIPLGRLVADAELAEIRRSAETY